MINVVQSMVIGLRRRWKRGCSTFLSVLGAVWLVTEVLNRLFSDFSAWLDGHGALYLIGAVTIASLGFLVAIYETREVSFTIPNSGTTLTLKFSDIFKEDAHWIIGVNEFFDSTLGDVVAASSIHGQIITKIYAGNQQNFRRDVDSALMGCIGKNVSREIGQNIKYPLGTTAVVPRGPRKMFLVAISNTDAITHRSSSTVPILWDALGEALRHVDRVGNGEPLAMPLIGNGRASLNIPPQHLLRLITLKLVEEAKNRDISRNITINLADDCFKHLDLVEIKRGWSVV